MITNRSIGKLGATKPDPHLLTIRRWPLPAKGFEGLPATAKVVWFHIYDVAGGVERSVVVHAGALGRETGSGERAAHRALDTLQELGLVSISSRRRGEITVFIEDPVKVARMRLLPGATDPQADLFPETEPSEPADEAHQPPILSQTHAAELAEPADEARQPPAPLAELVRSNRDALNRDVAADVTRHPPPPRLTKPVAQEFRRIQQQAQQSRTDSAEAESILSLRSAIGTAFERLPNPEHQAARAEEIAAWITAEVNDPDLFPGPVKRVAWAVVEGEGSLDLRTVERVLSDVKRKAQKPGAYFVGVMKKIFYAKGIPWDGKKGPEGPQEHCG